jgi:predicted RNA-binding Zn ribbon-like protein
MSSSGASSSLPSLQTRFRGRRGGALCLDFINTVDVHDRPPGYDDLHPGYANVLAWCEWAEVLDPDRAQRLLRRARKEPRAAADVRKRAVALRESLFRTMSFLAQGETPGRDDLATLEREILNASAYEHLQESDGVLAWQFTDESFLERVLWPIVVSAEKLLLSPDAGRVRECAGDECQWLFLDTTRNRSRRYCSPTGCGNRERVRRFRQQRAGA